MKITKIKLIKYLKKPKTQTLDNPDSNSNSKHYRILTVAEVMMYY